MRLKSRAATLAAAAFLAAAFVPPFALAQEDPDNNGRYQIVNGFAAASPGAGERQITILLDTQIGRTWMIATGPEGVHWARLQMKLLAKVPDNMVLRPGPVTPFAPAK